MKPLETNRRILKWLYAVPSDESDSKCRKITYTVFSLCVILIGLSAVLSSTTFLVRNVSVSLEETLFSLFHNIAGMQVLYQSLSKIFLRHKLKAIFERLSTVYNRNKDSDSFHLLMRTNEKCEWIWPYYIKYVLGGFFASTIINSGVSLLICYIVNRHFDVEHVYHPYKFILPWNQSTLLGYSVEICFDLCCGEAYFLSNGALLLLFTSICLHHETFYEIFQNEANKLDYRDRRRHDAKHLSKMISFHNLVKDWFLDSAEAYSIFILVLIISSTLLLACCVFQLDLQMKHPDFGIIIILMGITAGLSILFAYCYCGRAATESYEKMAECLYEANWHELSPNLQKYFVIMIVNAQTPICYHGFGFATLNLQTFTNMIRVVASYYMMFKTLTSD